MSVSTSVAVATLGAIREEIGADSSLFTERLNPWPGAPDTPGYSDVFTAVADRGVSHGDDYVFALEYIYEGYLLHYGVSRLLGPDRNDFHLLAGDYMYARGLNRTAAIGDLFCIRTLAGLVELCSYLHCESLDRRLALNAWAVVSVRLADRAAGDSGGTDYHRAFEEFATSAWGSGLLAPGLDSLLEQMLSSRQPPARREIEGMLEKIYADNTHGPEA